MLQKIVELRDRSRRFREAARKTADTITKRQFAENATVLAQLAEVIEREVELDRGAKIERYAGKLSEALNERARYIHDLLNDSETTAMRRIKAWRARAEELRTTAGQFPVPSAQEALRKAAASFDKLATQAAALLARPLLRTRSVPEPDNRH
jgi:hypothetical protein